MGQLSMTFEGSKNIEPIKEVPGMPIYFNLTKNATRTTDYIQNNIGLIRVKQDMARWRNALIVAENKLKPNRTEYYRMCKDVALDNHLSAIIHQRKTSVLCRDVVLVNEKGEVDEEKTKLFKKSWFRKLLDICLDKKYYGFSFIDLGPLVDFSFPQIQEVPREYVRPELNIVVPVMGSFSGIAIDDPKYVNWNIFIGDRFDLGLYVKAGPFAIWKKGILGYWSEYCEKFGMPLRVGKTNVTDDIQKANMEMALRSMGSAFWSMIGKDDEIQLLSPSESKGWENYEEFRKSANEELSKLILCQTGTTDEKAFAGSAGVHQDVLEDVIEADVIELTYDLNEKILPVLNFHGFGLEGLSFELRDNDIMDISERAKIDASFMPYMKFDKEYLEKKYDIKLDDIQPEPDGGLDGKKSLTNYEAITNEYSQRCPHCEGYHNIDDNIDDLFSNEERERLIKAIQDGDVTPHNLPLFVYEKTAKIFEEQILKGFDISTFASTDSLVHELRTNVYIFSGAKTYQQVRDIHKLLVKYPKRKDLFLKNAKSVFDNYNKNWLSAEVDNAYTSSIQARNWKGIESHVKTLPFLEYQTAGDSRVRPTHAALDGITRKVGDAFWDLYYPPNGWRCRCTTIQHHDVEQVTDMRGFNPPNDVPPLFRMNCGKDGIIFSKKHPYFKVAKGDKEWAIHNFGLPLP